jgi:hypothetical protein
MRPGDLGSVLGGRAFGGGGGNGGDRIGERKGGEGNGVESAGRWGSGKRVAVGRKLEFPRGATLAVRNGPDYLLRMGTKS